MVGSFESVIFEKASKQNKNTVGILSSGATSFIRQLFCKMLHRIYLTGF